MGLTSPECWLSNGSELFPDPEPLGADSGPDSAILIDNWLFTISVLLPKFLADTVESKEFVPPASTVSVDEACVLER